MRFLKILFIALLCATQAAGDSNTLYNPQLFDSFETSKLTGYGQGVSATCAALTTTNIDYTLTDDIIMTGAVLIVSGASVGDYIDLQVLMGSTVIATPISNWYLPATGIIDYQMVVPKKIVAGLKLRVVVHTTVLLVTPFVAINYKFWKVLQ